MKTEPRLLVKNILLPAHGLTYSLCEMHMTDTRGSSLQNPASRQVSSLRDLSDTGRCWDHRHALHTEFYLIFEARAADTVAAAPLTTTALCLAGGEKAEKFPKPSKEPSTVLVELFTLIGKERQEKEKIKVKKDSRINSSQHPF